MSSGAKKGVRGKVIMELAGDVLAYNTLQDYMILIVDIRDKKEYEKKCISDSVHISEVKLDSLRSKKKALFFGEKVKEVVETAEKFAGEINPHMSKIRTVLIYEKPLSDFEAKFPYLFSTTEGNEKKRCYVRKRYPNMIIPDKLYLCNHSSARKWDIIKALKITAILNVTEKTPNAFQDRGIHYLRIPVEDAPDQAEALEKQLLEGFAFLRKELSAANARVIVHCQAGVSRSATVLTAFLMKYKGLSLIDTLTHLSLCRPQIFPNRGFLAILSNMEVHKHTIKLPNHKP
ncbi:hypothetical protein AAMO2058_000544300 [Amorphochlora amoebiformis]